MGAPIRNREFRKHVTGVTAGAQALLHSHAWPGNVRELRNAVERAMLRAENDVLDSEDFPLVGDGRPALDGFRLPAAGVEFEELERDLVAQALERAEGSQAKAAPLLGMNRDRIRYRIEKFGIVTSPEA